MCRRQFGSTRACYTPIKEREGVLPQGGLVHLPWPQKGLTFTPWCWHDLQTRSLCCLGGYWNCLEPAVDLTDRQEEIISFISGMPCHILGSEKIWLLLENTRKDSYFLHFYGNMWLWFYKRLCQIHWMLEHDMTIFSPLKSPTLNKLTHIKDTK